MSKRSEVVYINGAPSKPGYLLALLQELSHVPRDLPEIAEAKHIRKTNQTGILYQFQKRGPKVDVHVSNQVGKALSNGAMPKLNVQVSGRISVVMSIFSVFGLSYVRSGNEFCTAL